MNRDLMVRVGTIAVAVVLLFLCFEPTASAYIDAGSGSYLFQMAIAGIIGGLYTVKLFWRKLTAPLIARLSRGKQPSNER